MRPEAIRARPMSTRTMPASVSGRASAPVRGRVRVTWVPATLVGAVVTVVSGVEVTVVPSTCSVVVVDGTVMVVELTLVVVVDGTVVVVLNQVVVVGTDRKSTRLNSSH